MFGEHGRQAVEELLKVPQPHVMMQFARRTSCSIGQLVEHFGGRRWRKTIAIKDNRTRYLNCWYTNCTQEVELPDCSFAALKSREAEMKPNSLEQWIGLLSKPPRIPSEFLHLALVRDEELDHQENQNAGNFRAFGG